MITAKCRNCGKQHSVDISNEQLSAWKNGAKVQEAFSNISEEDRELFFLSGICGKCWDILFPEED